MKEVRHVLVMRFSALGDVAMTVPVVRAVLQQNPQLHITYLSVALVQPLFEGIERLQFVVADLKGSHKGVFGLYRLSRQLLKTGPFDGLADLHQVLRTKILRTFFATSIKNIAVLDKGRKEKAELTRVKHKVFKPLPSTFERYARVFHQLGLTLELDRAGQEQGHHSINTSLSGLKEGGVYLVGLAPFAKHAEKMYPLERMKEVVQLLSAHEDVQIFLLGGKGEAATLEEWTLEFSSVTSWAGVMPFRDELEHIGQLDLMISMDSANMHLASLAGVPVVSVWGATHPYAGFYGWNQSPENAVQVALYCRPCSVFGNRRCYRGDHACMHSIEPETIYSRVMSVLHQVRPPKSQRTEHPGHEE